MTFQYQRRRSVPAFKLALTVTIIASLTGCALLSGPEPAHPQRSAPPPPETVPVYVVGGSAAENQSIFTEVLRDFSESEAEILGRPVVDALIDVGFERENLQVSFDRTKTDLYVDSIFVAARFTDECLVGQLATKDRTFAVEFMTAVGPNNDICLIGETREIDW